MPFTSTSRWRGLELRALYTGISGHKLMLGLEAQDDVQRDQAVIDPSDPAKLFDLQTSGVVSTDGSTVDAAARVWPARSSMTCT